MSETILKCENLCKHFGKKQILDRVSLEVKQGDILGFIGPNGAGKTTTLRIISTLIKADSGDVFVDGGAGGLLENTAQIGRAHKKMRGQTGERQRLADMGVDVG